MSLFQGVFMNSRELKKIHGNLGKLLKIVTYLIYIIVYMFMEYSEII